MYEFAEADAAEVADTINEMGNTVTLNNGDTMLALVQEGQSSIEREVGVERVARAQERGGRAVLFYVTPTDAARIPPGTLLTYKGAAYTPEPGRDFSAADTSSMIAILATTGGRV